MNDTLEKYNESNQLEKKKPRTLKDLMLSDQMKASMGAVLPRHLTPERMARCAIATMVKNPKLAQCTMESMGEAMMTLSQLGLEPDGRRAHLIPFNNKSKGTVECQLLIDYKGLVSLIMRTGLFSRIHADVVCDNDEFEYDCGVVKKHKINFKADRGTPYAVWCVIVQKDGAEKYEVMTIDEVEKIRSRSRSKSNGPWVTDYNEMCKKTVFRRAAKWVPWEKAGDDFVGVSDVLDAEDKNFESNIEFEDFEGKSTIDRVADKAKELNAKS